MRNLVVRVVRLKVRGIVVRKVIQVKRDHGGMEVSVGWPMKWSSMGHWIDVTATPLTMGCLTILRWVARRTWYRLSVEGGIGEMTELP